MPEVGANGGGTVAGDVTVVFQHEQDELLGGTAMRQVIVVGIRTHPSETFLQFRLPAKGYTRAAGVAYAEGFALTVEAIAADPRIVGMQYREWVTKANQIKDQLLIFWESETEDADGWVVVDLPSILPDTALAAVAAAMASF